MKKKIEYIIVPGLDCYWHVIPKDKEEDWNNWCETNANRHDFLRDDYVGKHPSYAKLVKGDPSSVIFKEFRMKK